MKEEQNMKEEKSSKRSEMTTLGKFCHLVVINRSADKILAPGKCNVLRQKPTKDYFIVILLLSVYCYYYYFRMIISWEVIKRYFLAAIYGKSHILYMKFFL